MHYINESVLTCHSVDTNKNGTHCLTNLYWRHMRTQNVSTSHGSYQSIRQSIRCQKRHITMVEDKDLFWSILMIFFIL